MSNCIHVAVGNICLYDYMLYTKHYQQKNISRKKLLQLLNFQMNIFKSVLLESNVLLGRIRGYGSCGEAKRRQKYHTTAQTTDEIRKKLLVIWSFILVSYINANFERVETAWANKR